MMSKNLALAIQHTSHIFGQVSRPKCIPPYTVNVLNQGTGQRRCDVAANEDEADLLSLLASKVSSIEPYDLTARS